MFVFYQKTFLGHTISQNSLSIIMSFLELQEICFMTVHVYSFSSTGTCQPTENDISTVERIVVISPVLK